MMQLSKLLALDVIDFYPLPREQHLLVNQRTLQRGIISNHLLPLLNLCSYFRNLEEHCELITGNLANPEESGTAVTSLLKDLQQAGIMVTADQWLQRIENNQQNTRPDPEPTWILAISTCDRPRLLQRLLDSAIAYITTTTLPAKALLLDDSRQADNQTSNQRAWASWLKHCSLTGEYWDRTARVNLCNRLCRKFAHHDAQTIRWLLSPEYVDERVNTSGQNRNLALLLSSGQRLLMLDDDCILTPLKHTPHNSQFQVGRLPVQAIPFHNQSDLVYAMEKVDINPFESHLHHLGTTFKQTLKRLRSDQNLTWLRTLDPATRKRLDASEPITRVTLNATCGDPGTASMDWLYTRPADCSTKIAEYLQKIPEHTVAERLFWRGRFQTVLTYDETLMTTTLTGLDNRALLPCVIPFGRGEDRMLGNGLRVLEPQALFFIDNWALPHEPEPVRYWQRPSSTNENLLPDPEHFLIISTEQQVALDIDDPMTRLAYLANRYLHLANLSDSSLIIELNRRYTKSKTMVLQDYAENQITVTDHATHLQRDLALLVEQTTQEIAQPLEFDRDWLTRFRQLAHHYGQALLIWPTLCIKS